MKWYSVKKYQLEVHLVLEKEPRCVLLIIESMYLEDSVRIDSMTLEHLTLTHVSNYYL